MITLYFFDDRPGLVIYEMADFAYEKNVPDIPVVELDQLAPIVTRLS